MTGQPTTAEPTAPAIDPAVAAVEADLPTTVVAAEEPEPTAPGFDSGSRAEQLRGLFDTARVGPQDPGPDAAAAPGPNGTERAG